MRVESVTWPNKMSLHDKNFQQKVIEGTYFNIIKAIYDKTIPNIIPNDERLKAFPLRSEARKGCLL